jgi:hypothetical protein
MILCTLLLIGVNTFIFIYGIIKEQIANCKKWLSKREYQKEKAKALKYAIKEVESFKNPYPQPEFNSEESSSSSSLSVVQEESEAGSYSSYEYYSETEGDENNS